MAPLELEGNTLGQKHQHFNKLVKEAISNNSITLDPGDDFNTGDNDIEHLIKIDVANEKHNVDYIIKVLTCEDMLYVSRALKNCAWLIKDPKYAHIINPIYLKSELVPQMTSKALHKFMKQIKLHLNNESRAEQFFDYETDTKKALKWLPLCSLEFINIKAGEHADLLSLKLLKRLCAKSMRVLEIVLKPHEHNYADIMILKSRRFEATKFLLHFDTARYLDVVEQQFDWICPSFGKRTTDFLMKTCSNRIIYKFEKYSHNLHLPTFIKHLKNHDIKEFLYTQARKGSAVNEFFRNPNTMKCFINAMPPNERTRFVNDVFINKIHEDDEQIMDETEKTSMIKFYLLATCQAPAYCFYDFETAFAEITKLIREKPGSRKEYFELLVKCADHDNKNLNTLLKYYLEKHNTKDSDVQKLHFLSKVLANMRVKDCDKNTWGILNELFKSLGLFAPYKDIPQHVIIFIILYQITHDESVSEAVAFKFFNMLKGEKKEEYKAERHIMRQLRKGNAIQEYQKHLDHQGKEKVFNYLLSHTINELDTKVIKSEKEYSNAIKSLKFILKLLQFCNKNLSDYPWVLDKIKEYVEIKKVTYHNMNLSDLYDTKKCWKRLMFHLSPYLFAVESVYVNMLKHDFELFASYHNEMEALCCNNNISPRLLLSKLRVYWPCSQAADLTNMYLRKLDQVDVHNAVIFGLCALLPRQQLHDLVIKYAPKDAKVDNVDDVELSVQKQLAKKMHIARPPPPADAVLLYAKGDYLKFSLPSLLAIYTNLPAIQARQNIFKLLEAPVSLQKHGIPFAQAKLPTNDVKQVFSEIWTRTKNATIRTRIFKFTYELLRKETDSNAALETWNLLSRLIDGLTHDENKVIYELLSQEDTMNSLPAIIRPQYLMKCYKFLKELIPNLPEKEKWNYNHRFKSFNKYIKSYMGLLPSDFVVEVLKPYIETFFSQKVTDKSDCMLEIMSAYILCEVGDKTRKERYQVFFDPLFQHCLTSWNKSLKNNDLFIRANLASYLDCLIHDLKDYVFGNGLSFPIDIYVDIHIKLAQLPISDNYIMVTKWSLFVELAKMLNNNKLPNWDEMSDKVASDFGIKSLDMLKIDLQMYFPCIYSLFAIALHNLVKSLMSNNAKWIIYSGLLTDREFVHGYLTVVKLFPYRESKDTPKKSEVRKMLYEHPSEEVKLFCKHKFK